MTTLRNKILLFLSLLAFLLGMAIFVIPLFTGVKDSEMSQYSSDQSLELVVKKLEKEWYNPEIDRYLSDFNFQCEKLKNLNWTKIPKFYYQCNPDFFRCILNREGKQLLAGWRFQQKEYFSIKSFVKHKNYLLPRWAIAIPVQKGSDSRTIYLQDTCRKRILPKGIYSFGKNLSKESIWENIQDVAIDKFLVTKRDYYEFYNKDIAPISGSWFEPAVNKTVEDMENYCAYRGGEVLKSNYLDAASFLPKSIEGKHKNEYKGFYPESHSRKIGQNFPEEKKCLLLYSKECQEQSFIGHSAFTWIGITQVLGGVMEYVQNDHNKEDKFNVMPSSKYFPLESPLHHIGARTSWDKTRFLKQNFAFGEGQKIEDEKYELGWRCMYR